MTLSIMLFITVSVGQDFLQPQKIEKQLLTYTQQIDEINTELLLTDNYQQKRLLSLRKKITDKRLEIEKIIESIMPALENIQSDIKDLGDPPSSIDNEAGMDSNVEIEQEPDIIKKRRAVLTEREQTIQGLLIQSEALLSKSGRLLEKIMSLRRDKFISQFFEPQISSFDKSLWENTAIEYKQQFAKLPAYFDGKLYYNLGLALSVLFFVFLIISSQIISRKQVSKQLGTSPQKLLPTVALSLIAPSLAIILGLGSIYLALATQGIITDINSGFIIKILWLNVFIFFAFFVTAKLKVTSLIRSNTQWLINIGIFIYIIDALILSIGQLTGASLISAIAQSYVSSSLFALLLAVFSVKTIYRKASKSTYLLPISFFWLLATLSFIIIASNTFSYAALSRFIFERTVMFSAMVIIIVLIRALVSPLFSRMEIFFQNEHEQNDPLEEQEKLMTFWLSLSLDIVLIFISLPIIASILGAEWTFIKNWGLQAFLGFEVGAVTISIANIGLAIGLFLSLLFLTKIIQKVLSQKILPNTKMDNSIQHSIIQVMGYIGLILALLVGISSIGFDLSNLALIAGALSVGIGFGLQSIVSNFVSGLILLFERPIKIGDWIITESGEGIVKKINVRATEIETFDRTSIIIPNSELISSSVKNWTLQDSVGRIKINVGVSYDSDPHQVNKILTDYINNDDKILKWPEPKVLFQDFADSALLFEVRFFIRNITDLPVISTQVRFDIWDKLKENKIEISFPQRDLHIRSAPGLKGIFNEQ